MSRVRSRPGTQAYIDSAGMRLLFDQNLSPHLRDMLADLYPGSIHVRDVELQSADDVDIWEYAAQQGLTIVSKDSDFRQRSFLFGHPPKVIWLRRGNCSTTEIETILRNHYDDIVAFDEDDVGSFFALV